MIVSKHRQTATLYIVAALVTILIGVSYWLGLLATVQAQLTDRFFTTAPVSSDIVIIDIDEESLAVIGQWPWSRTVHAELLQQVGMARAVGFDVLFTEAANSPQEDERFAQAIAEFPGEVILPAIIDEQSGRISYPTEVLRANSTVGLVNTQPDRDGVVRTLTVERSGLPSLSASLAGGGAEPSEMRVYYHGPGKTYTTLSYQDVYQGRIPPELFAGKTLLVGASAAGLGDLFQTPFGTMPGVEIHANAIDTLRDGNFLAETPQLLSLSLLVFFSLLVLGAFLLFRSTLLLIGSFVVLVVTTITLTYVAFMFGHIVPHLYLLLLLVIETGVLLFLRYLFETKEKHFIRTSFAHYVAPEVVEQLCAEPERLGLGGETRTVSILFSDIRGFTTISETLTPQELMGQLNEYLEEMSEAVTTHKGLVDKYIGDAVMAFWGAPLLNPSHAKDACESVLSMMKALTVLNQQWAAVGKPPFAIGIGISTGEVVVGNMGSRRRFNYSIIGDEVNFSARIEGLTKQYGVACLIGESTYQEIKDVPHLHTRELDDVMVKGKLEPRKIYELITSDMTDDMEKLLQYFSLGRVEYKKGNFSAAVRSFEAALSVSPNDGPSNVFLARSKQLLAQPPTQWSGVYEFKTK